MGTGGFRYADGAVYPQTHWEGLTVLKTHQGQPTDTKGTVEFVAAYRTPVPGQLHERSHFVKEKGRWFYLKGEMLPPSPPNGISPVGAAVAINLSTAME